jgi:hypothetical protein
MNEKSPDASWIRKWTSRLFWVLFFFIAAMSLVLYSFLESYLFTYSYLGFSPLYLAFTVPGTNLLLSLVAISVLITSLFFLSRRKVASNRHTLAAVLTSAKFVVIYSLIGCVHSVVYYFDKEAYIIDDKILAIEAKRTRLYYERAEQVLSEKQKKFDALANQIVAEPQRQFRLTSVVAKRYKPLGSFNVVYRCDTDVGVEGASFQFRWSPHSDDTCVLRAYYKGDLLLAEGGVELRDGVSPSYKYKEIYELCRPLFPCPDRIEEGTVLLALELGEQQLKANMESVKTGMGAPNGEYLPWHLFVFDTILSSLAFGQGYFKSVGPFSRALMIPQAAIALVFISLILPKIWELSAAARITAKEDTTGNDEQEANNTEQEASREQ